MKQRKLLHQYCLFQLVANHSERSCHLTKFGEVKAFHFTLNSDMTYIHGKSHVQFLGSFLYNLIFIVIKTNEKCSVSLFYICHPSCKNMYKGIRGNAHKMRNCEGSHDLEISQIYACYLPNPLNFSNSCFTPCHTKIMRSHFVL